VHRQVSVEFAYEMKSSALMRRTMFLVLALLVPAVTVYADDWGMGQDIRIARGVRAHGHDGDRCRAVSSASSRREQFDEWVRLEDMTHPLR
jgi:hypothetical protein